MSIGEVSSEEKTTRYEKRSQICLVRRGLKLISLDITPAVSSGRQLIKSYGEGGFYIAGRLHLGSVLLTHSKVLPWSINEQKNITFDSLSPLIAQAEILIIGCGAHFSGPPTSLRMSLRENGMSLEWMDTGAACRTFNVLLIEERDVAAALIAID